MDKMYLEILGTTFEYDPKKIHLSLLSDYKNSISKSTLQTIISFCFFAYLPTLEVQLCEILWQVVLEEARKLVLEERLVFC